MKIVDRKTPTTTPTNQTTNPTTNTHTTLPTDLQIATLQAERTKLVEAVEALGAMPEGLSGVKHAVNAPSFTFAPAPKPVTWPDGVTKMTIGPHQITIDAETGVIQVVWHGSVGSTPAQARQLAALLLAAADKVEGRG